MFSFDVPILQFFESIRTDFLNSFFEIVTMLGEETLMILLVSILYFAVDKRLAYRLFFVTACSMGTNSVIKNVAKVPRPFATGKVTCVRPETATGYSFPSGHTQNFSTWSPVLALLSKRKWSYVIVGILISLVAISRVYLGAHYPSDVLVGAALGLTFALLGNLLYNRVENKYWLYLGLVAVFTPVCIYFFFGNDTQYRDLFKFYGMISGVVVAMPIENKLTDMNYDVSIYKKILRVAISVVLAFAIKEGIKALNVFEVMQITYLFDCFRYFVMVVVVFGFCPLLIKKLDI